MNEPTCAKCKFFNLAEDDEGRPLNYGACRRHAPTLHDELMPEDCQTSEEKAVYMTAWPHVWAWDTCGDFDPRRGTNDAATIH